MRILIADSRPKVRFALRVAFNQHPGLEAIGEAIDADDLLAQTHTMCPDLVLVDWELPGVPIAELIGIFRQTCVNLRVIVLNSREETREQAMTAGADAFVCMCDAPDELLATIDDNLKIAPVEIGDNHKD